MLQDSFDQHILQRVFSVIHHPLCPSALGTSQRLCDGINGSSGSSSQAVASSEATLASKSKQTASHAADRRPRRDKCVQKKEREGGFNAQDRVDLPGDGSDVKGTFVHEPSGCYTRDTATVRLRIRYAYIYV